MPFECGSKSMKASQKVSCVLKIRENCARFRARFGKLSAAPRALGFRSFAKPRERLLPRNNETIKLGGSLLQDYENGGRPID